MPNYTVERSAPETVTATSLTSTDHCPRCGKPVYHAERRMAEGRFYHPTCYTCRVCDTSLNATNIAPSPEEIFCKVCYGRVRGPRGYGFGLGGKGVFSMTMTSIQVEGVNHVMHNPAMIGALDKDLFMLSGNQRRDEHPVTCSCHQCMKALKFTKVPPHDHMMTSNAGHVSLAYAWPLLAKERSLPPRIREGVETNRQPKYTVMASGKSGSGHRHQRASLPPVRDEPIAFLRRHDTTNIEPATRFMGSWRGRTQHVSSGLAQNWSTHRPRN